jgi:hypothetical protein
MVVTQGILEMFRGGSEIFLSVERTAERQLGMAEIR